MKSAPGWELKNNKLIRQFKFDSFKSALAFINQVGELADSRNHHPEIYNAYSAVRLELTTHESGGVTAKDYDLAAAINKVRPAK